MRIISVCFFCFHEPWLGRSAGINSSSVCFPLWWYLKTKGQHFTECGWWLLLQRNGWKQAQDRLATDWATRGSAELQDDPGAAELAMPVNWSQSWCSLISQACAGLSQSQVLWNVDLCVAAAEVRCRGCTTTAHGCYPGGVGALGCLWGAGTAPAAALPLQQKRVVCRWRLRCWMASRVAPALQLSLLLHFILKLGFAYETLCVAIYIFVRPSLKLNQQDINGYLSSINPFLWLLGFIDLFWTTAY